MKTALLLAACLLASPAGAADKPLRLSGGPKSEDALRRFVAGDAKLKAKLNDASAREQAFLADSRDPDLRDAVSGADKAALLAQLPGLKAVAFPSCRTLAECAAPELTAEVADAEMIPDAVRALIRPWMLLQQARGSELRIAAIDEPGDAALSATLTDLDAPALTLNVSPRSLGGFRIWFDRPLELAALYGRERTAALKSPR